MTNATRLILAANNLPKSFTKIDLLNEVMYDNPKRNNRGYYSGYFSVFNLNDIITYNTKTKMLEKGENYHIYIVNYINGN